MGPLALTDSWWPRLDERSAFAETRKFGALEASYGMSSIPKNAPWSVLASTLNAAGQPRVTLLLRQARVRAACGPRQEERGLKPARKRRLQAVST